MRPVMEDPPEGVALVYFDSQGGAVPFPGWRWKQRGKSIWCGPFSGRAEAVTDAWHSYNERQAHDI